jgi:serine/threonine protein phosphatase 1
MWGRKTLIRLERAESLDALDDFNCTITGIDHVFVGHTIVNQPVKHCNRSWIDTGAYKTNVLTFVEIDDWINE